MRACSPTNINIHVLVSSSPRAIPFPSFLTFCFSQSSSPILPHTMTWVRASLAFILLASGEGVLATARPSFETAHTRSMPTKRLYNAARFASPNEPTSTSIFYATVTVEPSPAPVTAASAQQLQTTASPVSLNILASNGTGPPASSFPAHQDWWQAEWVIVAMLVFLGFSFFSVLAFVFILFFGGPNSTGLSSFDCCRWPRRRSQVVAHHIRWTTRRAHRNFR